MNKHIIAVAGNMGAGKTSLVQFLHRRFQLQPFYEPNASNPYLTDFYQDMKRWAFSSQIHFLTHKFKVHRELEQHPATVVQDRTIFEDAEIFEKNLYQLGLLSEQEHRTYRQLYEAVLPFIRPPDLMLYLKCPVRAIRQRIRQRGRPEERELPAAYIRRLNDLYEQWFSRYELSPVIVLDTSRLDYVSDLVHHLDLLELIEKYL